MHNNRMKLPLLLMTGLILLAANMAYAQSPEAKFSGQPSALDFLSPKKNQPTPEQIDASFAIYDECKASDMLHKYYDCECLSARYLQFRTESPKASQEDIVTKARKSCGNTVNVAGLAYQRCLGWAPKMRSDYERYCTCYANSYARNFTRSPTDSIRGREIMMTNALNSCNNGSQIADQKARQNLMGQLKKEGLYDTLFPGAKTDQSQELN